jgi:hypothetical protein
MKIVGFGGSLNFFSSLSRVNHYKLNVYVYEGLVGLLRIFRGLINGHVRKVGITIFFMFNKIRL